MLLKQIAISLLVLAFALSTWLGCVPLTGPHAAVQVGQPVSGMALRQGRRFSMEDRTVMETSVLPGGTCCNDVKYTYAAVYDGHEGSAACNMLQQQLHPLVRAAAAAAWQASCSLHTNHFQAALKAAAQQVNDAFLQKAQQAQLAQQHETARQTAAGSGVGVLSSSDASSPQDKPATSHSFNNEATAGTTSDSVAAAIAAGWDGDDGSTAVFAVLVGRQLVVGNVGNSKAILCTRRNSSSSGSTSSQPSQQAAGHDASHAVQQRNQKASAADGATDSQHSVVDSKVVMPYPAGSPAAAAAANNNGQLPAAPITSSSSSSSKGICSARSATPSDPPQHPLTAIPLSSDHTPAREDEAARIIAAGGQVFPNPATPGGKPRVRGELEVTRSFGDLGFQGLGVVPIPDFTTYDLQQGDAFIVLASDGVFEAIDVEDVCQHAWAVWSGSSSIQAASPPPPALAVTGQVAAGSLEQQQGADTAAADSNQDTGAGLQGCCDCTPQQKLLEAAEAVGYDSGVVIRPKSRYSRRGRSKALVEQQQPMQHQPAAVAVPRLNGVTAPSSVLQQQGSVPEAASGVADNQLVSHQQPLHQQQQLGLVSHASTTTGQSVDQCIEQVDQCSPQVTEPSDDGHQLTAVSGDHHEDEEYTHEDGVADATYAYCKNPTNITSPYTLPQAIALRLVGEAYNRMSMDNLAVVVLDVRALAASSATEARQAAHPPARQGFVAAGMKWFSSLLAMLHRRVSSSLGEILQPHVALPQHTHNALLEAEDSDALHALLAADVEALQALDVTLPVCNIHELIDTSEGLFVGPRAVSPHGSSGLQLPQAGGKLDAAEPLQGSDLLHPDSSDSAYNVDTLHGAGVNGAAIMCQGIPASTDKHHPQAIDDLVNTQQLHSFRLVEQVASAVHVQADHLHLHPVLGIDELGVLSAEATTSLAPGPEAPSAHDAGDPKALVDSPLWSVARHLQPTSLFHRHEAIADRSANQAELHSVLHNHQAEVVATTGTDQHLCESWMQERLLQMLGLPASANDIVVTSTSGHVGDTSQVASEADGLMSACLVGMAADAGVVVTQGGHGLSAVVEALAALPLHDELHDVDMASGIGYVAADQASESRHVVQDSLIEPAWGRVVRKPHNTLPYHQQHMHADLGMGSWMKAGLLFMATSRPGRTLLSRQFALKHAMPHHNLLETPHIESADVDEAPHEASYPPSTWQVQHAAHTSTGLSSHLSKDSFDGRYKLGKQAGRGHFGEVWLATRLGAKVSHVHEGSIIRGKGGKAHMHVGGQMHENESAKNSMLVLKRVLGDSSEGIKRSALREAYFGHVLEKRRKDLLLQQSGEQSSVGQHSAEHARVGAGAPNASALLAGHNHLVRFIEGFTSMPEGDVWLVFQNEGLSLHDLMYEATSLGCDSATPTNSKDSPSEPCADQGSGLSLVGPSKWWMDVRASPNGNLFVASMMRQLLQGLEALHTANISHRDVKPENLLVALAAADVKGPSAHNPSGDPDPLSLHLRLIDFGSAVDAPSIMGGLYGPKTGAGGADVAGEGGPSLDEVTLEYAAPEVLFSSRYHHPLAAGMSQLHAYDIWSAGVVMLELILGTPAVFTPSPATRAAIDRQLHLRGRPQEERRLLYTLRGLMELCLYPPRAKSKPSAKHQAPSEQRVTTTEEPHQPSASASLNDIATGTAVPLPWSCSDDALLQLIASRDPTGVGLGGGLGVRLLQRLLAWEPTQRPTATQALQHAYFVAAEHMQMTGSIVADAFYQGLLVHCSELSAGERGWC